MIFISLPLWLVTCTPSLDQSVLDTFSQLQFLQCSAGQTTSCRTKTSLSVVSIEPQDKADLVSTDISIRISLSEKISSESITLQSSSGACSQSIQLGDANFENCVGLSLVANADQTVTLKPTAKLDANKVYKIKIKNAILAVSGLKLVSDYVQETGFKTAFVPDTTPPTVSGTLSFSGISATGLTVNWNAASDDFTASANLQYKLVKDNVSVSNINTISLANSKSGADLVLDWTTNALSQSVISLTASTSYHFTVLVRDSSGNVSQYTPSTQMTAAPPDVTAPTTGTAISIPFASVLPTGMTLDWGAGSDAVTITANLEYKLVKDNSSTANISTVALANAKSGSDLLMNWSANILLKIVTGLTASTTYHFAVLVRDAAGNMSLYSPVSMMTSAPDVTPPVFSGLSSAINFGNGSVGTIWSAGTDSTSPQSNLVYEICYNNSSGVCFSSFTPNGGITSAGATSFTVTGLTDGTYYFVVRCRDEAGNVNTGSVEFPLTTTGCPGPATCS
ncbi:Ig-like domain-containing protein [Leptospira sp. 'Mane']|uniref:Ig-like domain-containing protein n=1 Tax=Leptospira sp. 'Mane' TaxID=3387407 RepID=UPI00398B798B